MMSAVMSSGSLLHAVFWFAFCYFTAEATNCKGCTPLDSLTFDKIMSKFKASVIKFDVAYPYGDKHDEFAKLAETAYNIPDLFIGEVGVKDYGDKENKDLADRFDIDSEESFPVVKLFLQGQEKEITFHDDFTEDNLKRFIRQNSGIWIGLRGCIEQFDKITKRFLKEKDTEERRKVITEAEDAWNQISGKSDQKYAEVYVKMMRKVLEKGDSVVKDEVSRLKNLTKMKNVSNEKKKELQNRLNIIYSFSHDEL